MSNVFGKTNSDSRSSNQAYGLLANTFTPTMNTGVAAGGQIANMLGLNGTQGQDQAFKNWQNSTGYQFGLNQGMQSINGNAATQGLLNSGATLKALNTYGQNYADTQYGNYTNQLHSLLSSGLQAGSVLSSAGNVSSSNGAAANGGIGAMAGDAVGMLLGK